MPPKQPKSILKKKAPESGVVGMGGSAGGGRTSGARVAKDGRPLPTPEEAREIAVFHARQIELRKKAELAILESIEALIDTPMHESPETTAANPVREDVDFFKHHLRHFRPADYDEVVRERNIVNKCGYALCPLPNKKLPRKATHKFVDQGRRVVEQQKLERYCGDACARRALWIRVQLSEEPAWVREGITEENLGENVSDQEILLLEEQEAQRKGKYQGGRIDAEAEASKLHRELKELGIKPNSSKSMPAVTIAESKPSDSELSLASLQIVDAGEETATRKSLAAERRPPSSSSEDEDEPDDLDSQQPAAEVSAKKPSGEFELSKEEEELIEEYQRKMALNT